MLFPAYRRPMKNHTKLGLTEGLLVFGFFVFMTFLNVAGEWSFQNPPDRQTIQLREALLLDVSQEQKVALVNKKFYDELARAYSATYTSREDFCITVNAIIAEHNQKIEQALNAEQRKKFQTLISCHDLP